MTSKMPKLIEIRRRNDQFIFIFDGQEEPIIVSITKARLIRSNLSALRPHLHLFPELRTHARNVQEILGKIKSGNISIQIIVNMNVENIPIRTEQIITVRNALNALINNCNEPGVWITDICGTEYNFRRELETVDEKGSDLSTGENKLP